MCATYGIFVAMLGLIGVEPGTIHAVGLDGGHVYHVMVTPAALKRTPAWTDTAKEPPLSPLKAMLLADAKREEVVKDSDGWIWELEKPALHKASGDHWYYEITYLAHFPGAISTGHPPFLRLIVLMDGTVPEPVVWKRHEWMRALQAGAFNSRRPRGAAGPVAGQPVRSSIASGLGALERTVRPAFHEWLLWVELYYEILIAPKLEYRVEKLYVYRDGVWADFAVTNRAEKRRYVTAFDLERPVMGMKITDDRDRRWRIPQFAGHIHYGTPDTFIAVEPGDSVRFRCQLSTSHKPLALAQPGSATIAPERPTEVAYSIARWAKAYPKLSSEKQTPADVYALGTGKTPISWSDRDSPNEWATPTRLGGER